MGTGMNVQNPMEFIVQSLKGQPVNFFTMYLLPGDLTLMWSKHAQPNNCCWLSYFDTFQIYLPACKKWTGVWCLVSLKRATLEQTKQSSFFILLLKSRFDH